MTQVPAVYCRCRDEKRNEILQANSDLSLSVDGLGFLVLGLGLGSRCLRLLKGIPKNRE